MATGLKGLYAITPDERTERRLVAQIEQALSGGVRVIQYRRKLTAASARASEAAALLALCRRYGARLIVNDDPHLALAIRADGVHLGREDGAVAPARALLGPASLVGVSCYDSYARAEQAVAAGADYIAFGAMFPSPTKPQAPRAPVELIARARVLGVAVAAIGGISLANAPALLAAGADLLAVITDLFDAPDITARARDYLKLFGRGAAQ